MAGSKGKIRKYLNVEKHKIHTKIKARVVLELKDYKEINATYGEDMGIHDIDQVMEIPGFFTLEFPDEQDSIDFFFPFNVYLQTTSRTSRTKDTITIDYMPEDMVFYANYKESDTNIYVLKSLYENGVKYLGDKPDKLIVAIWQQLQPANVPWHHLELIVSQLYSAYDKKSKQIVPLRLTGEKYSKSNIDNLKNSVFNQTRTMPIQYGYSKDALRTMLSKKNSGENSFFENIVSGNYDELTKEYKDEKEAQKLRIKPSEEAFKPSK